MSRGDADNVAHACVIASGRPRSSATRGAAPLDMTPDRQMAEDVRLGPGHLGAIVSVVTPKERSEADYRAKLARFHSLSHLTIEVRRAA